MGIMEIGRHDIRAATSRKIPYFQVFCWERGEGEVSNYVLLREGGGGGWKESILSIFIIYMPIFPLLKKF